MLSWSSPSASTSTVHFIRSASPSTSSLGRTLLGSLTRSRLYHSLTSLDKTKLWSRFYVDDEENVQKVLDAVSTDQKVITNPRLNGKRRTVIVTRRNGEPFGFAVQTYLLKKDKDGTPKKVSYIDYVHLESAAADAGIRAGDVIISINGQMVTDISHSALIELIASSNEMRMVVIFDNIRQRIELSARALRLRKLLNDKLYQLNLIDIEEQKILSRAYSRKLHAQSYKGSFNGSLCSERTSSVSSFVSATAKQSNSFAAVYDYATEGKDRQSRMNVNGCDTFSSVQFKTAERLDSGSSKAAVPSCSDYDQFSSVALKHVIRLE